ncbi:DUF1127 domain-containing protein [Falsirhodobacter deserti]|uniref:DUF1127 domain-containing protein n=1 Tax=Falsirhodobacter deserti TaxID=1365611 RepID=UPI000FE2C58C|nr:DUF1127 domain-containing protein [Falsirhodobacter deserti]
MAQAVTHITNEGFRFGNVFSALKASMQRRAIYRQTVAELNALSSRDLGDLGLDRSSIRAVAYKAAYGN